MLTRVLAKSLYGLFGVVFLVAGVSVLLLGTGLLPPAVKDFITGFAEDDPRALHLMQEMASLLVLVGVMTFWFILRYDDSRVYHWAMTVFWALIALVHWFDVRGSFQAGLGQVINTVPFALFLVVGLLREGFDKTPIHVRGAGPWTDATSSA